MRSRPPALRGLAPPLTQSWGPIKIRSMRPPPRPRDQPTCSRWVSYSCCLSRRAKAGEEFFSANSVPNKSSTLVRPILEEEAALVEEAKPRKALHHLPLPPSLPYSPNSHPFKRQIEILSLYISGASPGQSWEIFNGIHVDIRRYIPDHIFRSLVIHQLASDDPHDRWSRSSRLLRFANKCGMEAKDLGQEVVEAAMPLEIQSRAWRSRTLSFGSSGDPLRNSSMASSFGYRQRPEGLGFNSSSSGVFLAVLVQQGPLIQMRQVRHCGR